MPRKSTPNIDFMTEFVKEFLENKKERIFFDLDFHYYLKEYFDKMYREFPNFAEAFYFYIAENGVDIGDDLPDGEYKKLIRKQFKALLATAKDGLF